MEKAIVLLSGGADSAAVLGLAVKDGYDVYPISFNYGQRHNIELQYAKRLAEKFGCLGKHIILDIPLNKIKGSALTDSSIEVPKDTDLGSTIPITYVPARNTIFMSFALAYAEVSGAKKIFIGANVVDYSNYPDCRPDYFDAFQKMANLATKAGVEEGGIEIITPLIKMTKAEIYKLGMSLSIAPTDTFSCYDPTPEGNECGHCPACLLKNKGLSEIS